MDPTLWWTAAVIVVLLCCSAFFSGSETALTAVDRATLHHLSNKGSKGARTALSLTEDNERLIGSILLGNNLVNVLATSLATTFFIALLGEGGVATATLIMTILVTVFAEIAPKTYAINSPDRMSVRVGPAIALCVKLFAPVVGTISFFVQSAFRFLGLNVDPDAHALAPYDRLRGAIAMHASEGSVDKDDRDRLIAALDLREREVAEIMRHRRDIESISADEPPEAIVAFCLASAHTRIPLWRGEPENIIGVLHAKDLLRAVQRELDAVSERDGGEGLRGGFAGALKALDVMGVAMKPWFVPDTRPLEDQLRAFLKRRSHFALVVDEYGSLQGLVTLEDILEEIVGEITDEHDIEAESFRREADGSVVIEGSMTIRDVNRAFDWDLPSEEATTIAGLLIHEAQAIPTEGQVFAFHGVRFEVIARERHQITRLRLTPLQTRPAAAEVAD
ncbi:MAG: HlyC/CorC family transporter [Pseudomonadota bacterium]